MLVIVRPYNLARLGADSIVHHPKAGCRGSAIILYKAVESLGSPASPLQFHSLLKFHNVPAPEAVAALWKSKAGDAQVEAYGSGGGSSWYIAKMLPYEDTRYDMGSLTVLARVCKKLCQHANEERARALQAGSHGMFLMPWVRPKRPTT